MRPRRFFIAAVVSLLAAAAITAAYITRAHQPSVTKPVTFRTVTAAQLAVGKIRLWTPTGSSTAARGRSSAAAASKWFGGLPVLEKRFALCVEPPAIDEDCWAVSLDTANFHPPGGTPPGGPVAKPVSYLVVLVQPRTDKILDAQGGRG